MFMFTPTNKAVSIALFSAGMFASSTALANTEFVPGQTKVANGDVVMYQGECYQAQNNPGVWETPSASSTWFWTATECDAITDPVPTDPDPTDPEPTDPEPTNPDPTDPEPTDPIANEWDSKAVYNSGDEVVHNGKTYVAGWWCQGQEPGTTGEWGVWKLKDGSVTPPEPEPTDPEPTDPEPTDPEPTDPEPTDPEPIDPEPIDPEPTDPEPTDPEPIDPEPIDPEPIDPEPTDPEPIDPEPIDPTPTPVPGELCKDFNVYPDWTQGTFANTGDIMVHDNIAHAAKYYTTTIPGSDSTWVHHLNCDGTEKGEAAYLSLPNRPDPVNLKVAGWPGTLVVVSPSVTGPSTIVVNTINSADLSDSEKLSSAFEVLIHSAEKAGSSSVIISSDVLDNITADKGAYLGAIAVKQALAKAVDATGADISDSEIAALTDDAKGWAQAQNLIMFNVAPNATFGWSLSIGEFAYGTYSGKRAVWNAASKATADLLDSLKLYSGASKADFVTFTKSGTSASLSNDQWHNALEYVKQVTDFVDTPAMLSSIPTAQAADYFMGQTASDRQLRKAAHSNVFSISFDADSSELNSKIDGYHNNKIPLYHVGGDVIDTPLTSIPSLNSVLEGAEYVMDNEVFLYETPSSTWIPSTIYNWVDFLAGLNSMHNVGVADNKFWLLDPSVDDATNEKYAKVAIAAFLAQSMQETIRFNACDENNWAETKYGAPVNYPNSASCGQLGQNYADYGVNPISGKDHAYSCPRTPKMEVSAQTHAEWYGAPAPIFASPDSVLAEAGVLVDGAVGRWDHSGVWCGDVPTKIDTSKQVWEREECKIYVGQKSGGFVFDGSSQKSVEGCGWWGRGVIQTTGRQNFGTLNHFLGRSHVDPTTIGATIDGQLVKAPPENPLYADLDLCSNPQLVCSSEENAEIKWIAGLFFWMTSVQEFHDESGLYPDWNYYTELKAYVDGGMQGTGFIDAVSGIVNRGCPDNTCPGTGDVHAIEERRANFKLVLETLGANPQ